MAHVWIRPDLRTAGGESNDIILDGKYAGNITLVYREGQRLSGSIQLDKEFLSRKKKEIVVEHVKQYVQSLVDAYGALECDVMVNLGEIDQVIATEGNIGVIQEFLEDEEDSLDFEADYVDTEDDYNDVDRSQRDEMSMSSEVPAPHKQKRNKRMELNATERYSRREAKQTQNMEPKGAAVYYELVIVGESDHQVEYHIYNRRRKLQAEVFVHIQDRDVVGEVSWQFRPTDTEIENATDLIVSDYDEDEIDTFLLDMKYDDELLETIELAHDDFFQEEDGEELEAVYGEGIDDDISILLSRDDGDTLTYEVYKQTRGGLPIGSATVDISRKEISGFIDFHDETDEEEREEIAIRLMKELDKEKSYDTFDLTMLENNEWIDEILFENDTIH